MSTGLATVASSGRSAARCWRVCSLSGASSKPSSAQASAHRIASPPAFDRIATRLPWGSGWVATSWRTSHSSCRVCARITPACSNSASTARSEPASAAVCDIAARSPIVVDPLFSARTGFCLATRLAMRAKRRGFPTDSR